MLTLPERLLDWRMTIQAMRKKMVFFLIELNMALLWHRSQEPFPADIFLSVWTVGGNWLCLALTRKLCEN